jgi:hypothetical protein
LKYVEIGQIVMTRGGDGDGWRPVVIKSLIGSDGTRVVLDDGRGAHISNLRAYGYRG